MSHNLPHIIAKVTREPWACLRSHHVAILDALEAHMEGRSAALDYAPEEEDDEPMEASNILFLPVHGTIGKKLSSLEMMCGGCSLDMLNARLSEAAEDDNISAIVLDVHSPGGTVTGVHETVKLISEISDEAKPVYAFTDTLCCSAAYWLASQADKIFATRTAQVGSIGVFSYCVDQTAKLEKDGIKVNEFTSGKYKTMGAPWRAMTDEERAMIQASVMRSFEMFSADIKARRDVKDAAMQGQVFDGDQAAAENLVDSIVDSREDILDLL